MYSVTIEEKESDFWWADRSSSGDTLMFYNIAADFLQSE